MAGLDATVAQISAVAAAAIPGPHQFSEVEHNRVPQVGPKLWTNEDGSEFVTEAEQGLSGLLGRFIEVPKEEFQKLKEHALQEQMQLDLMGGAELGCCPKREFSIFGLPMIYPVGGFTFAWMTLISLLDITYAAFWVPMNVAFCSTRYGDLSTGCTKADLAGGVVYTLHLLLGFQIGAVLVHGYRKKPIMNGWDVARSYIKYGRFWLDLVSSLPFFYLIVIILGHIPPTRWVAIASLFRLVRMSRLVSLGSVVFADAQRGEQSSRFIQAIGGPTVAYIVIVAFGVATVINLEACLLVLVAEFEGRENSWMSSFEWMNLPESSAPYQWYMGVYAAIASNTNTGLAGVGYVNKGEMVVCMIMQLLGMIMFSMIITITIMGITRLPEAVQKLYRLRTHLVRVRQWLRDHDLPPSLEEQVLTWYYEHWAKRTEAVREDVVVRAMPGFLRAGLLLPATGHVTAHCHWLGGLEPQLAQMVSEQLVPLEVDEGQELCAEGEAPRCCWVLERGVVEARNVRGDRALLHPPALLGESLLIAQDVPSCGERLWSYTTVAPCKLWRLALADATPLLRCYPALRTSLLAYVQGKLTYELVGLAASAGAGTAAGVRGYGSVSQGTSAGNAAKAALRGSFPGADDHWCELVERVVGCLRAAPPHITAEVRAQLARATLEAGTLTVLLESLAGMSTLSSKAAEVVGEVIAQPSAVKMARASMAVLRTLEHNVSMMPLGTLRTGSVAPGLSGAWPSQYPPNTDAPLQAPPSPSIRASLVAAQSAGSAAGPPVAGRRSLQLARDGSGQPASPMAAGTSPSAGIGAAGGAAGAAGSGEVGMAAPVSPGRAAGSSFSVSGGAASPGPSRLRPSGPDSSAGAAGGIAGTSFGRDDSSDLFGLGPGTAGGSFARAGTAASGSSFTAHSTGAGGAGVPAPKTRSKGGQGNLSLVLAAHGKSFSSSGMAGEAAAHSASFTAGMGPIGASSGSGGAGVVGSRAVRQESEGALASNTGRSFTAGRPPRLQVSTELGVGQSAHSGPLFGPGSPAWGAGTVPASVRAGSGVLSPDPLSRFRAQSGDFKRACSFDLTRPGSRLTTSPYHSRSPSAAAGAVAAGSDGAGGTSIGAQGRSASSVISPRRDMSELTGDALLEAAVADTLSRQSLGTGPGAPPSHQASDAARQSRGTGSAGGAGADAGAGIVQAAPGVTPPAVWRAQQPGSSEWVGVPHSGAQSGVQSEAGPGSSHMEAASLADSSAPGASSATHNGMLPGMIRQQLGGFGSAFMSSEAQAQLLACGSFDGPVIPDQSSTGGAASSTAVPRAGAGTGPPARPSWTGATATPSGLPPLPESHSHSSSVQTTATLTQHPVAGPTVAGSSPRPSFTATAPTAVAYPGAVPNAPTHACPTCHAPACDICGQVCLGNHN